MLKTLKHDIWMVIKCLLTGHRWGVATKYGRHSINETDYYYVVQTCTCCGAVRKASVKWLDCISVDHA